MTAEGSRGDGTFTFLFTDVEDSTGHWERTPDAMRDALQRHDALLRAAADTQGGHVFKTIGDAFCVAFPNAVAALSAAFDAQRTLTDAMRDGPLPLRVRM